MLECRQTLHDYYYQFPIYQVRAVKEVVALVDEIVAQVYTVWPRIVLGNNIPWHLRNPTPSDLTAPSPLRQTSTSIYTQVPGKVDVRRRSLSEGELGVPSVTRKYTSSLSAPASRSIWWGNRTRLPVNIRWKCHSLEPVGSCRGLRIADLRQAASRQDTAVSELPIKASERWHFQLAICVAVRVKDDQSDE